MPIELKPVVRSGGGRGIDLDPWDDGGWMRSQDFSYDAAWQSVTNTRRGSITGGPSYQQFLSMGDRRQWAIVPTPPPLTQAVLAGERLGERSRIGTVELDFIDPFASLSQLTGDAIGRERPLIGDQGSVFDPLMFLQSKNIDLFGMDSSGAPARLADYTLAIPIAVMNKLAGRTTPAPEASDQLPYRFQRDPAYWQLVATADDERLRTTAIAVAGQYIDPARNSYLVDQLFNQFRKDRDQATGVSSGNERIDYLARLALNRDLARGFTAQEGLHPSKRPVPADAGLSAASYGLAAFGSVFPFVGTSLMESIIGVDPALEERWRALDPAARQRYIAEAGGTAMATELVAFLPALSGLGAALAIAKASTGVAGTAYRVYDGVYRGMNWVMAAGIGVATTNWALSAAWPEYAESFGQEIDRARPISSSMLAGAVNAAGFWSSGTWGGATAVKAAGRYGVAPIARGVGKGLDALGVPRPSLGSIELAYYRDGMGGKLIRDELAGTGLSPQGLDLSGKRSLLSYTTNLVEREARSVLDAAMRGLRTGLRKFDEIDDLVAKQELANDELAGMMASLPERVEGFLRVLQLYRAPAALAANEAAKKTRAFINRLGRDLDDDLARQYTHEYGPDWIARHVGEYTPEAMEAWAKTKVAQLGGDPAKLSRHGLEDWAKIVRTLHNYEFDWWNGEVAAALRIAGPEGLPDESGRVIVMRSDHLFFDEVSDLSAVVRGEDEAAAKAAIAEAIRTKREAAEWFASDYRPPAGVGKVPENVTPATFADWLDDIHPALPVRRRLPDQASSTADLPLNDVHRRLEATGTWTLGFKPVNEAGEYITYARTRSGSVFKSPFVDYPIEAAPNLELGNRGWVGSKMDSVFRGFRTWRITEFQRGNLFRSLTGRFDFLPEQIDRFHQGVLALAREKKLQPQTVGTVPREGFGGESLRKELNDLAESIFGKGPYQTRAGAVVGIEWHREVAKAYRQSLKLNLTAGLTSHLKWRLGPVGEYIAWASDIAYPMWRFNLSPLFKGGEITESLAFNIGRGVDPRGDPVAEALFYRGGLGNDYGIINQELAYDQTLQGLAGHGSLPDTSPGARLAASAAFHARLRPDDFASRAQRAAEQEAVRAFRRTHLGGSPIIPNRPRAPGAQVGREVPEGFSGDSALFMDPAQIDPDLADELRGMWHATTNIDGVLHDGLLARQELYVRALDADPRLTAARRELEEAESVLFDLEVRRDAGEKLGHALRSARARREKALNAHSKVIDAISEPMGLGGGFTDIGQNVSVTVNEEHAAAIAHRLKLAARAARDEVTVEQIIDEFIDDVRLYPDVPEMMYQVLARKGYLAPVRHQIVTWDDLIPAVRRAYGSPRLKYQLVQHLDEGLNLVNVADDVGGWPGVVGLTADWDQMKLVDPDKIGIVRVAARTGDVLPDGAVKLFAEPRTVVRREGPDWFELQFDSKDLWVIDDRPPLRPIAYGDRDELLAQLRASMREEPTPIQARANQLRSELDEMIGENGVEPGLEERALEILDELERLDAERLIGDADRMGDVAGTPEALEDAIENLAVARAADRAQPSWKQRAWETFIHPTGFKQRQAHLLQMKLMADEFPELLRISGNEGAMQVFRDLGIPESKWAEHLLRDRELLDHWLNDRSAESLQKLLDHAGGIEQREAWDALYASPEWGVVTSLWNLNVKSTQAEAFGVHFFSPYRSAFERSINHPMLGVYPASWAFKAGREWARFLFQNRTIPGLSLGMLPAVAVAQVVRAQQVAFSQSNPETLEEFLRSGPLGSSIFIFNLLMPGDWSAIPFPLSRTIREILRGNTDPAAIMAANLDFMGATRDFRLFGESAGEIRDLIWGAQPDEDPEQRIRLWSVTGTEGGWQGEARR